MSYDVKIVNCGNVMEVYRYTNPICEGFKVVKPRQSREQTEDVKNENKQRSIKRTKRKIFELVNSNYVHGKSSFLTLTFKENLTDLDLAYNYWDLFKKRVEYKYSTKEKKFKLEYCGVVEFQTKYYHETGRRAIHFHICLFNVPYIKQNELYTIWNDIVPGGVNIQGIKDEECDNVGAYMTYYMNKGLNGEFWEDYKNKKKYFYSRGLKKPVVTKLNLENYNDFEFYYDLIREYEDNIVFEYTSKFERKELIDNETYTDMETGEIKKAIYENILYSQELEYKQILLKLNKNKRKLLNKNKNIKLV